MLFHGVVLKWGAKGSEKWGPEISTLARAPRRVKVEKKSSPAPTGRLQQRRGKMGVQALEHVTVRCAQLQRTRDFYVELMGLTEGDRPKFPFRGHWLYLGGIPVVHLVE